MTDLELRGEFRQGARDILPILLGVVPFGLVAGAAAIESGLTIADAMGLSLFVFAGASQLAAIDLIGRQASVAVTVFTIAVINLRMLMYSAALAPVLSGISTRRRVAGAFLLTDQAFAVTIGRAPLSPSHRHTFAYYLGAAVPLYVNWQVFTLVGALLGAAIPSSVPLGFAIPMVFLVLLVPVLTDRPAIAAAVTAGVGATVLGFLPSNLGLFASALLGVGVGTALELRRGGAS